MATTISSNNWEVTSTTPQQFKVFNKTKKVYLRNQGKGYFYSTQEGYWDRQSLAFSCLLDNLDAEVEKLTKCNKTLEDIEINSVIKFNRLLDEKNKLGIELEKAKADLNAIKLAFKLLISSVEKDQTSVSPALEQMNLIPVAQPLVEAPPASV